MCVWIGMGKEETSRYRNRKISCIQGVEELEESTKETMENLWFWTLRHKARKLSFSFPPSPFFIFLVSEFAFWRILYLLNKNNFFQCFALRFKLLSELLILKGCLRQSCSKEQRMRIVSFHHLIGMSMGDDPVSWDKGSYFCLFSSLELAVPEVEMSHTLWKTG